MTVMAVESWRGAARVMPCYKCLHSLLLSPLNGNNCSNPLIGKGYGNEYIKTKEIITDYCHWKAKKVRTNTLQEYCNDTIRTNWDYKFSVQTGRVSRAECYIVN